MCNIWKNKIKNEMKPSEYLKLPYSLREINITGGEPFLRDDIDEVVKYIKKACMNARIVISSNGYLSDRIESKMRRILNIDSNVALRISIDGPEYVHNKIRGIDNAFQRALESIIRAKKIGVRDIGIAMTISNLNVEKICEVFNISEGLNVQFTISVTSSSDIYFGKIDDQIRNFSLEQFDNQIKLIAKKRMNVLDPKEWARAWFEELLLNYVKTRKRPFHCDAGEGFFYMDSQGNVHGCHIINSYIGNINEYTNFEELWNNGKRNIIREMAQSCNKCWMVCTSKSQINKKKIFIGLSILRKKFIK
jgi:MoaA/NifB/PqqE/SkfB family radical SAM enzyme